MRLPLLALAAVTLVASGCDTNGIDTPPSPGGNTPTTPGGTTPPTARFTFAPVNPAATYLRTDQDTDAPIPFLLADYGLQAGDVACFRTAGDFAYGPGLLASSRTAGTPLATGIFSGSNIVNAVTELRRVKDALDGSWNVDTLPTYGTGAPTNVDEDFDATDACYTVPTGATHFFLSAYDDAFLDNTDVQAGGQEFGVFVNAQP